MAKETKQKPLETPRGTLPRWRIVLRICRRVFFALVVVFAIADFMLETYGLPHVLRKAIFSRINSNSFSMTCRELSVGVFHGVVMADANMWISTPAGNVFVQTSQLSLKLEFLSLLKGAVIPNSLRLNDLTVSLYHPKERVAAIDFLQKGRLHLFFDQKERLHGVLSGRFLMIDMTLNCMMDQAREALLKLQNAPASDDVVFDEEAFRAVCRSHQTLRGVSTDTSHGALSMRLTGNLSEPETWSLTDGHFAFTDASFDGIPVQRLALQFSARNNRFVLDELHLTQTNGSWLKLHASYSLTAANVVAQLNGLLTETSLAEILQHYAGADVLKKSHLVLGQMPVLEIAATAECPVQKWTALRGNASLKFLPSLHYVDGLSGEMTCRFSDGRVHVEPSVLTLGQDDAASLEINGDCNLESADATGGLRVSCSVPWLLGHLGVTVPQDVLDVDSYSRIHAKLNLAGNLRQPSGGRASGELELDSCELMDEPCRIIASYAVDANAWKLEKLQATRLIDGLDVFSGAAVIEHPQTLFSDKFIEGKISSLVLSRVPSSAAQRPSSAVSTALQTREASTAATADVKKNYTAQEILNASGGFSFDLKKRQTACNFHGRVFPERLYRRYIRGLNIPPDADLLRFIDSKGTAPLFFDIALTPWKIGAMQFCLRGSLHATGMYFRDALFERVACTSFEVTDEHCLFNNIQGVPPNGEHVSFDLAVQYDPLYLRFSNAHLKGDPRCVGLFFANPELDDVYARVFRDIVWSQAACPDIQFTELTYEDEGEWRLKTSGIYVDAQDVRYTGLHFDALNLVISMDLPNTLRIDPAMAKISGQPLFGRADLSFTDVPRCSFSIYPTAHGVNTPLVLRGLVPDLAKKLEVIHLDHDSILECTGSLNLQGEPKLRMKGKVQAPTLGYKQFMCSDVKMDWTYNGEEIFWDVRSARVADGTVICSGNYNLGLRNGEALVRFNNVSVLGLKSMLVSPDDKTWSKADYTGVLSGECHGRFMINWADYPLYLKGTGALSLREGQLWRMPILSSLGQNLGNITELDTTLEFKGTSVESPLFYTNGTLIALRGTGAYDWDSNKISGVISGIPIQKVKMFSWMLFPVTSNFDAEISGTIHKYKWHHRHLLRRLFW